MIILADKKELKEKLLRPKTHVRQERLAHEYSTSEMAALIGLKNRRQYEQKEKGKAPFHDYEMLIIAHEFKKSIIYLFYEY